MIAHEATTSKRQCRHHSALIVEDNLPLRDSLARLLRFEGYDVRTAGDMGEAFARLADDPLPCVILLDWSLPGTNGVAFLDRLRADPRLGALPVVVTTAGPVATAPGLRVFYKPFDTAALIRCLDGYCRS